MNPKYQFDLVQVQDLCSRLPIKEVVQTLGCDYFALRYFIKKHNISFLKKFPKEKKVVTPRVKQNNNIPSDKIIIDEYVNNLLPIKTIAVKYNTTAYFVQNVLKRNNIEITRRGIVKTTINKTTGQVQRLYWFDVQEQMITEYLVADNNQRSKIFEKYYYFQLQVMAEAILKKHFTNNLKSDFENKIFIADAVSHVSIRLDKFKPEKIKSKNGLYSFCQMIIKNFYFDYFAVPFLANPKKTRRALKNSTSIYDSENGRIDDKIDFVFYKKNSNEENFSETELRQTILSFLKSSKEKLDKKTRAKNNEQLHTLINSLIWLYENLDFSIHPVTNLIFCLNVFPNEKDIDFFYKKILKRINSDVIRTFFPSPKSWQFIKPIFYELKSIYDLDNISKANWDFLNEIISVKYNEARLINSDKVKNINEERKRKKKKLLQEINNN